MGTETTTSDTEFTPSFPDQWQRRHLLDLESLSAEELQAILQVAQQFKEYMGRSREKLSLLKGRTCANIFFEDSTRTRNSFSLAARRLGADTVEFSASSSSVSKGETIIDTAKTIEAPARTARGAKRRRRPRPPRESTIAPESPVELPSRST